ncbi:MAG: NAD+ kinase [Sphingobacteriales bacterium]|jgi:NAD+ kinase
MRIAIYGRSYNSSSLNYVKEFFDIMSQMDAELIVFKDYLEFLQKKKTISKSYDTFQSHDELEGQVNYLLSIGGDGTLLDTVTLVRSSGIPVLGINMGRLGFLAGINKQEMKVALESLMAGHYTLDQRRLIRLESESSIFGGVNYALNECTIHKKHSSAMIRIHAYLNGEFLNSYWADGLIIATPTGSTGYSLSCGGPIIFPQSGNFVITPISPHNLNVRPVIISDNSVITFEVEGRSSQFNVTLDSRTESIKMGTQLAVRKTQFELNLVRLSNENFLTTLRNKLMWGLDTRN